MADLTLVRKLPDDWGKGFAELYQRDGEYIVVSTVNLSTAGFDMAETAIIGMGAMLGGYATSGEETMAFRADAGGEVTDWGEIAMARGEGSRDDVLEDLRDA